MRQQDRITAALPILSSQFEFISRLRREKVLVVTAETGSGKTTQLPQYCAEAFGGVVVCTQPRVIAAISVAQRISQEFDGTSAGKNVGYTVGGGNSVKGQCIMLMTDSSLVRMAQNDTNLMQVSVLIIDEAHERSLNTDIVLGIAKQVRNNRKEDFHVVIASATIDPKPFLDFFFSENSISKPLIVPGRTFPVVVEYVDDIDEDDDLLTGGYLISKVIKTLNIHQEGHCLVFLPGSGEVDNALCQFSNEANPEWIGLPLSSADQRKGRAGRTAPGHCRCLLGAFQEQLGHMILPCNPKAGAYLIFSSMKAHLSHSTALAIARAKTGAPPYFVAMSITKIPNGMTIADRAHPIKEHWLTRLQLEQILKHSLEMSICYCRENLSKRFLKHIQTQIASIKIGEEKKHLVEFVSCYYDSDKNAVCVSAPKDIASDVNIYASQIIEIKLKEEREYEQVVLIGEGSGYATVIGGLRVNKLEQIGNSLRVKYFNPPVKSNDELKSWICANAKISDHMIKWHRYYPLKHKEGTIPGEPYAIAVFYDELSAGKTSKINTEQGSAATARSSTICKDQGQKLILKVKLDESITRYQLEHLLPNPISINTVYPPSFSLRLRNIPPHAMSEKMIAEYWQACMDQDNELANPKINITGDQAFVSLPNATSQTAYIKAQINIKQSSLGQISFIKQITTKKGHQRSISVTLEAEIMQGPITLSLLFANTSDAEQFITNNGHISSWPEGKLYAEAVVHVQHLELYDIQSLESSVVKKYAVNFSVSKTQKLIKINGKSPKQVGRCSQTLQSYLCPLKIHLGERKQQVLVTELYSSGCLFQDANDCGVFAEPRVSNASEVFGLTIYGPQSNQGQFMSKIGNYSNAFEGRAGSKRLQALQEGTNSAKIVFLKSLDSIEIVINPDIPARERANIFKTCKEGIQKIVLDLCGDNRKIVDQTCVKSEKWMQKQGPGFESLFSSAKAFVEQNWSFKLGDPQHIDENPGIKRGCPAMVLYCNAILSTQAGGGVTFPPTLFAWHGTSSDQAIQSICHNGFDPTRRSGKAHGIGEYFGQSAEVSHGYAQSTSRMIVAQLLQVQQTSTTRLVFNCTCKFPPQKLPYNLFGSRDPGDEDTEI
eukprot:Em0008g387a